MAFLDPFQSLFDRSRRNQDQVTEEGEEEEEADDSGDLQALIDVGEAEGIRRRRRRTDPFDHRVWRHARQRSDDAAPDIVGLPETATIREARDIMLDSKYSRLPVYGDQIDDVKGIIYVRDLLRWAENSETKAFDR